MEPENWFEKCWAMKTVYEWNVWKLSQEGTKTSATEFVSIVMVTFYLFV